MINRLIQCRFCWQYHEIPIGSFAGHVLCPTANEPVHHGQPRLSCHVCGAPAAAGHRGEGGKPACPSHVERDRDAAS
jgi:hypothetical protein